MENIDKKEFFKYYWSLESNEYNSKEYFQFSKIIEFFNSENEYYQNWKKYNFSQKSLQYIVMNSNITDYFFSTSIGARRDNRTGEWRGGHKYIDSYGFDMLLDFRDYIVFRDNLPIVPRIEVRDMGNLFW